MRARALGAQLNRFEAFPFYAAAVLLAEIGAVPQRVVDGLAAAFIVAGIVYMLFYLSNRPTARQMVRPGWGRAGVGWG